MISVFTTENSTSVFVTFWNLKNFIHLKEKKRTARKLLAKCQKQPWQQPCNLIVSHEETFRQFVSPSHEQTASRKWPRLFSWKNKVSKAQTSFGQNTFNRCFFSICLFIYHVLPKHYKEIYIFKSPPMWQSQAGILLKSNTTQSRNLQTLFFCLQP